MEPLPNTAQFITSIIHQLSKFHPPSLRGATASSSRPRDQSNSGRYQHHHLPSTEVDNNRNPLSQLPTPLLSKVKPLLLTLHCLFPNELLLALDILDRQGIKRYESYNHKHGSSKGTADDEKGQSRGGMGGGIYFVPSSSPPSSSSYTSGMNPTRTNNNNNNRNNNNSNNDNPSNSHIVCLNAWNCSCPAFALAAYQHLDSPQTTTEAQQQNGGRGGGEGGDDLLPAPRPRHTCNDIDYSDDDDDSCSGYNLPSTSTTPFLFGGMLTRHSMRNMHYGTPVCKHLLACLLGSQCPALFGGGVKSVYVGDGIGDEGVCEVAGRSAAA
ncbi:hypothetical protein AJ78_00026 [Emergomyces pasteurianus Ep9510]|uniref:SWIM-type domain-containing protein n=1 Tax=Emergomyces pasteurianus Ep9510 TaxID=1447872 RepID=A0A1J9PVT9_9EURO|nr:hypothetical protein AJ78_00026 [Emergomyces pasteurianus Ep9510]